MPDQLLLDGVQGNEFQIGRAWSSAGGQFRGSSSDGFVYGLLPIEGHGRVGYDDETIDVEQDHLILLDGAATITVNTPEPVARYLWRFRPEILRSTYFRRLYGHPLYLDPQAWRPVAALINSTVAQQEIRPTVPTQHVLRAHEHLLADLVDSSIRRHSRLPTSHRDTDVAYAQQAIEENYFHPGFTVEDLARLVGVSSRTLRRRFAALGTTPRAELSRRRAIAATSLLDAGANPARDVAERTGFTSVEQMRAAYIKLAGQTDTVQRTLDLNRARIETAAI